MAKRISALAKCYNKGLFGKKNKKGIILSEVQNLILYQVAAWPETLNGVGIKLAEVCNLKEYPLANKALSESQIAMLRIEPLKWWIIGIKIEELLPEEGSILDLSHSRTHLRISGNDSISLLNRHLPIDLRESSFSLNSVASTAFHHCSVTIWRSKNGYELFLPRAFACSLWEVLLESATQFGYEIK
jgi:heterotetrameric sarcosine oxidase gamma subunit